MARTQPASGSNDALFRSLFQAYPDSMLIVDPTGAILMANPAAVALLGYGSDELHELNVDDLVPDQARSSHKARRESYTRAPHARPMGMQMDLTARRKDGSTVRVEIALSPLQWDRKPVVVAAIRNIDDYPRVKQALRRARYSEHLASFGRLAVDERDIGHFLSRAPVLVAAALDVDAVVLSLVERGSQGLTIVGIVGDESLERLGEPILLADGSPSSQVMASGKPLIFASGSGSGGAAAAAAPHGTLAVPITERNTTVGVLEVRGRAGRSFGEDELRFSESAANLIATTLQRARSEEALSHAQRLESVGQLTGGIAHDFNNLLTVIQGNLQILEELPELAHSAHANDMLQSALRAAQRGAALTGKLLTFSRRQMLQPVPVDVRVMLHSLCDMLYRTVDQRIRIEVDVPARELPVLADLAQLESALLNVALNSRDAMPRGGTILFRAEVCTDLPVAAREMLDQAVPAGMPFVEIAISDTGSGMADHVKARVFEPFFTTKEVGRGTGLGLSTVYGYLKQSKGAITVESEPGVGTRISLFLPLLEGSIVVTRESPRESRAFGRGLRALLVEDDDAVRDVVEAFLEGLDIKVTSLRTAEDAVAELSRSQIDLVISDVALGEGMRGTELARVIGRTAPSLPVILMSGYSAELIDEDRDVGNVRELLRKPFRREEFARAVAEALAAHPDIDPPSSAIAG